MSEQGGQGRVRGEREPIGCERLERLLEANPRYRDRLLRQLLIALHERGIVEVDDLYEEARAMVRTRSEIATSELDDNPNRSRKRWDSMEKEALHDLVQRYAAEHMTEGEVTDLLHLVRKRERARTLEELATLQEISKERILEELRKFNEIPLRGVSFPTAEIMGTRVALIRRFITDRLDLIGVAKHYIRVRHMEPILEKFISGSQNLGMVGGKAAGVITAKAILSAPDPDRPMDQLPVRVRVPESRYISSSVHEDFMQYNRLLDFRNQKYKPIDEIRRAYPVVLQIFRNSSFSPPVVEQLGELLEQLGETPLIVRSSSLLEDSFGMAFSGKYRSIFLGNQGTIDQRLDALQTAIAEVYASVFHPDPIQYRRNHDMLDYDEHMGVLIQKVVGRRHGDYYFPMAAGVAFSSNEYRWSRRIRKEDGLVRLVMGLGTRAVDRIGDDYPRMISLTAPRLRPEVLASEIRRYSQRQLDVINLASNRFETLPLRQVLGDLPYEGLEKIVSVEESGHLSPPLFRTDRLPSKPIAITFDRFIDEGVFTKAISSILRRLKRAYKGEVDLEFAWEGGELYLLQCRPLASRAEAKRVQVPRGIPADRRIFSASRHVPTAQVRGVEVIVYVDPLKYDQIPSREEKMRVGRCVGALNELLDGRVFILMGPGRWGSNDINLGVRVSYADISNTRLLVEIARAKGGHVPEVSYGTHFFQDLVEDGIHPLALYPDEPGNVFNERFLTESPNSLPELLPSYRDLVGVVQVIDIPEVTGGMVLDVVMDGEADEALAFLREG